MPSLPMPSLALAGAAACEHMLVELSELLSTHFGHALNMGLLVYIHMGQRYRCSGTDRGHVESVGGPPAITRVRRLLQALT